MRMVLGDYTMAIAGMKVVVARKKLAMAKVCVTMKALYGMAFTAKTERGGCGWKRRWRWSRDASPGGLWESVTTLQTVQEELGLVSIEGDSEEGAQFSGTHDNREERHLNKRTLELNIQYVLGLEARCKEIQRSSGIDYLCKENMGKGGRAYLMDWLGRCIEV